MRLRELDALVWACEKDLETLSSRGVVFLDDSVKEGTIKLQAELVSLNEKRRVVRDSIAECERILVQGDSLETEEFNSSKAFDSKYIVHNPHLLWNGKSN